jgi:hypothetical protein
MSLEKNIAKKNPVTICVDSDNPLRDPNDQKDEMFLGVAKCVRCFINNIINIFCSFRNKKIK